MEPKQFTIMSYASAGPPWESHGKQLQTYFVKFQELEDRVMWNKQVEGGSPEPGPIWGFVETVPKKDGSGTYLKFRKGKNPGYTSQPSPSYSQPGQPAPQQVKEAVKQSLLTSSIGWGEAVIAAAMIEGPIDKNVFAVLATARILYASSPHETPTINEQPPVGLYDQVPNEDDLLDFEL